MNTMVCYEKDFVCSSDCFVVKFFALKLIDRSVDMKTTRKICCERKLSLLQYFKSLTLLDPNTSVQLQP
jgi:hypothetical protein